MIETSLLSNTIRSYVTFLMPGVFLFLSNCFFQGPSTLPRILCIQIQPHTYINSKMLFTSNFCFRQKYYYTFFFSEIIYKTIIRYPATREKSSFTAFSLKIYEFFGLTKGTLQFSHHSESDISLFFLLFVGCLPF